TFVTFSNDQKSMEKNFKNGYANGRYLQYQRDANGALLNQLEGQFKDDKKTGSWYTVIIDGNERDTIETRNYKEDLRHGKFETYLGIDTFEIANYSNDIIEGEYIMKTKITGWVQNSGEPESWWSIRCEGFYLEGEKSGEWKYYSLGNLKKQG